MNWGVLHSIATVAAFIAFVAIAWWAYSPKNKKRFEEDAQLALDDSQLSSHKRTKDIQ
ncbi:cytochrome C [Moraxella caviae]|uniref:Cbb3-type cytochrome oxidase, subunit 3 n=1 Tax=Moraxella caviae TaxID=34060 RepID=A0A1T0ADP0_9GAMM|nr:CcoQ/FixQ family Cbb3-type cytochrome c oxidase assembly chaperone [Moraxella caviae]OOR93873.1 cytochrome C [Moraxella caviae]STZ14113.1 Cbb3-type cytochrome oxidase, subunit 3 [Moraxella caviae]